MNEETKNQEQLQAEIEALKAQLKQAKAQAEPTVQINPDKGTVSVKGLQRFPVTLYPDQWEKVLSDGMVAKIRAACGQAKPMADAFKALPPEEKAAITAAQQAAYFAKRNAAQSK